MAWHEVTGQHDWNTELEMDPQGENDESSLDLHSSSGETEKDPKLNGSLVPLVLLDRSVGIEARVKIRVKTIFDCLDYY